MLQLIGRMFLNGLKKNNVEYFFSENLCPIPIDQRYCDIDMKKIIEMIQIDTQL